MSSCLRRLNQLEIRADEPKQLYQTCLAAIDHQPELIKSYTFLETASVNLQQLKILETRFERRPGGGHSDRPNELRTDEPNSSGPDALSRGSAIKASEERSESGLVPSESEMSWRGSSPIRRLRRRLGLAVLARSADDSGAYKKRGNELLPRWGDDYVTDSEPDSDRRTKLMTKSVPTSTRMSAARTNSLFCSSLRLAQHARSPEQHAIPGWGGGSGREARRRGERRRKGIWYLVSGKELRQAIEGLILLWSKHPTCHHHLSVTHSVSAASDSNSLFPTTWKPKYFSDACDAELEAHYK